MTNPNERISLSQQDIITQFLRRSPAEFEEFLRTLNTNARVTIKVPLNRAPDYIYLMGWFRNFGSQFSEITIQATKQEYQSRRELFDIPGVKWEETE